MHCIALHCIALIKRLLLRELIWHYIDPPLSERVGQFEISLGIGRPNVYLRSSLYLYEEKICCSVGILGGEPIREQKC